MEIIDRINALLKQQGRNGSTMCREIGIAASAYSQWNTGKTRPGRNSVFAIATYLNTTTDYLLYGIEPETPDAVTEEKRRLIISRVNEMSADELSRVEDILKYVTRSGDKAND